jgi:8-oxo-dGTP pyrophosphatase MutT (NUDIX family)
MSETATFGTCLQGTNYVDRPAAYVVVAGQNGTVAVVQGPSGLIGLPGGGALPGETAEETVGREVREELARDVRLVRTIGTATQYFYAAADDCHYKMAAVFFLAELPDEPTGQGEHELLWLPVAEAERALFHACHAWAVRRGLVETTGRGVHGHCLTLVVLGGTFAICRLEGDAAVPPWVTGDLVSITRTAAELSIVCCQSAVPEGIHCELNWRCLRVAGPLPFSLVGVLASLTVPLAESGISIFALSTFDADYLLIRDKDLEAALSVLRQEGHTVVG